MFDLRFVRENEAAFDRSLARRGQPARAAEIVALDERKRAAQTELQEMQARRNALSKEIGVLKRSGGDAEAFLAEMARLKDRLPEAEATENALAAELETLLSSLPNLLDADVPDGADETANVELRRHGTPAKIAGARDHADLGPPLGMDFERGAALSGARFTALVGPVARLERALGQFMLDLATREFGYTEVSPPLLVRDTALYGTGQLPKFAEDLFRTTDDRWLIPTAEVALTNLAADRIWPASDLPMRLTALTPCFRSEAGAAGKDTRGMIRQHQFWKCELVSVVEPDASPAEHERMTECAETVLRRLELPYRTLLLCAGDTGFGAAKTYDIEVWLSGQGLYREISSCSNCRDFQARRMKARARLGPEGPVVPAHTLNGSGVAVGRALVAVLETYQQPDGSVEVPAALHPYMGGVTRLEPTPKATQKASA